MERPPELDEVNLLRLQEFERHYVLQHALNTDVDKKQILAYSATTQCRFCSRSSPEVTFKKEAHLVPQGLGNRYLVTNFECDECNAHFSKYENSFINFFSLYRPFAGIANYNRKKDRQVKHKETNITFKQEGVGKIEYQVHQNREYVIKEDEATLRIIDKTTYGTIKTISRKAQSSRRLTRQSLVINQRG